MNQKCTLYCEYIFVDILVSLDCMFLLLNERIFGRKKVTKFTFQNNCMPFDIM